MEDTTSIINQILSQFTPVFKSHGGGAEIVEVGESYVILRLKGHCNGCALAPLTFGLGVEKLIKEKLPRITEVRYTN